MSQLESATSVSVDFSRRPLVVDGTALVADASGALYWPDERVLIVADLHLEKGSSHARRGVMLPPYDTRETLARLTAVVERYRPRTVVALGDSLHDRNAASRLLPADLSAIASLQRQRAWLWVTGNHDPEIDAALGGDVADELSIGNLVLRHEPRPGPAPGEIAGHLHPAARLAHRGSGVRRPCFAGDGKRVVVPAFGAFTGGLNVLEEAFAALLAMESLAVLMLGQDGVYPVPCAQLQPD